MVQDFHFRLALKESYLKLYCILFVVDSRGVTIHGSTQIYWLNDYWFNYINVKRKHWSYMDPDIICHDIASYQCELN